MGATRPTLHGLRNQHISSWKLDTANSPGAIPVPALSVPMVNCDSDQGNRVNLHGAVHTMGKYGLDGSANIMMTGLASGHPIHPGPITAL